MSSVSVTVRRHNAEKIGRIDATMTLMLITKGFHLGVVLFLMIHWWGFWCVVDEKNAIVWRFSCTTSSGWPSKGGMYISLCCVIIYRLQLRVRAIQLYPLQCGTF